ncbi:MAG: hypothetical protein COC24_008330 [Alphaproteobacteria bacterium]|nr:hypothetical protein [Alphaproteobacteria bacterium]
MIGAIIGNLKKVSAASLAYGVKNTNYWGLPHTIGRRMLLKSIDALSINRTSPNATSYEAVLIKNQIG